MIFGHGIDLQEISAVKKAYDRNPRFAKKVLTPKDIEILNNDKGAPVVTQSPFEGNVFISISHSGDFVQASVILEKTKR